MDFKDDEVVHTSMDIFENHAALKVTDIVMDAIQCVWDAQQCWTMFSISMLNQLLTPRHYVSPEGIPHVSTVSFRFPPAPINSQPYVFKLNLTNVSVSEIKGYWAVFTSPPSGWKRALQQKNCNTANCPIMEPKEGHLNMNIHNPDMAAHLWAKKFGGNIYKLPNTCNTLKELSLFEITPTNGSLKNKESQVMTMKYSFNQLGSHKISVLFRVFPSTYVWLDLYGTTLDVNQSHLQLMNKRTMPLHPVCLFDMDPPVQMFWVYNGGNVAAAFSVDLEPFEKLKDENFGHAVIECLTPKGEVPAKSWSAIKLKFSPLEYTNYSAPLIIYANYDKIPSQVIVHGSPAINPAVSLRPAATVETDRMFVLLRQGVPVTLSPSHVTIGHLIPTGHSVTRMVFLTNLHARNTLKYYWENMPIEGGGMISFLPNCGRLAPKEEVACKVIIKAGDTAAVLNTMITCTIEDETATVLYEFVLNQWREYMLQTQLRDNDNISRPNKMGHKPEKPETYKRLLAVSVYIGSVFGQYDNIPLRERSRMGFVAPCSCEDMSAEMVMKPFTLKGSQFCQSIISDMIWDMVQSSNFSSFIRQATKRKAPLFEEYAESEQADELEGAQNDAEQKILPLSSSTEILEKSIFNIMQEMAERYARSSTKAKWHEIPPVQPKALIDVDAHKKLFQH